jgi:hypothetical protein
MGFRPLIRAADRGMSSLILSEQDLGHVLYRKTTLDFHSDAGENMVG